MAPPKSLEQVHSQGTSLLIPTTKFRSALLARLLTLPVDAPIQIQIDCESTPPLRPTTTGTRYGAGLLGSASKSPATGASSPFGAGGGTPLCAKCAKPVYFAEQVKASGRTFHRPCLRCTDCNTALDSSRLAEKGDRIVCRNCYSKVRFPLPSVHALRL